MKKLAKIVPGNDNELSTTSVKPCNYNINIDYNYSKQRYICGKEELLFESVSIKFELLKGVYNVNIEIVAIDELALKIIQNCICFSNSNDINKSNYSQDAFEYLKVNRVDEIEYHGTKLLCEFPSDLPKTFDRNIIPTVIIDRLYFIKTNFHLLKTGVYHPHHYKSF